MRSKGDNVSVPAEGSAKTSARTMAQLESLLAERNSELRRQSDRLALAVEAARTCIWDFDVPASQVELDANWSLMIGGPAKATTLSVRHLFGIVHPDDRARVFQAVMDHVANTKPQYNEEYRVQNVQGEWIWIHSRGRVTGRTPEGRALRMAGTNTNITQRKTAELALARQVEFLNALNQTTLALLQRRSKSEILEALAEQASGLLESDLTEVALIENEELVTHALGGSHPLDLHRRATRAEAVLSWQAVDSQTPVVVADLGQITQSTPAYRKAGYHSVAVFPILHDARCLGVLGFLRHDQSRPFSAEEQQKGVLLARLAALVIHNAAIYDDALRVAETRTTALRESERLYRTLVESVTHAHYIADRRGLFTYCNPELHAMGGFIPGELLGHSSFRLVAEEDRNRVVSAYRRWIADPAMVHAACEFRVVAKDGRKFWVEQTTHFVRDAAGRLTEGRNLLQDISARKKVEQAMSESEQKFRGVFDQSPVSIALLSLPEGRIVEINATAETSFGFKLAEVRGQTSVALGLWADPADRERYLAALRAQGHVPAFEARMRRRDGTEFAALYSGSLVTIGGQHYSLNSIQDITPRKQAEELSHRSLALARATLESTTDGILVLDATGRIETFNRNFAEMWRMPAELLERRDDREARLWASQQLTDPTAFVQGLERIYADEQSEVHDVLLFADGRIFERYLRPLLVDGRFAGRVISFRDVTARRQAETALRESEHQFRLVFDESPIPIILFSQLGGVVLEANRAAERVFGHTRAEAVGRTTGELGLWPDQSDRDHYMAEIRQHGALHGATMRFRVKSGAIITVLCSARTVDLGGQACLLNSMVDITAQKMAETALRDSETKFKGVFEASPIPIILLSYPHGRIRAINQATAEVFGFQQDEVLGRTTEELNVWPDPVRRRQLIEKLLEKGSIKALEVELRRKDGRLLNAYYSLAHIVIAGEPCMLASVVEITALKQAEAALRRSEAQLQQAQKLESLGTLAGGIAHDFNNILTGILGHAELAIGDLESTHPAQQWMQGVMKSGARAKNLVQQILTFSRKTETTRIPVRLQNVTMESLSMLRSTLPAMVRLESAIDPSCAPVLADTTQVHQVILNLCTNAWHAMPSTGGLIEIGLKPCQLSEEDAAALLPLHPGGYVLLTVRDNGQGMDAATRARIFEPFFTTKDAGKGTGLGLAVVHSIVAAHGGGIFVDSQPGQGALFEIYFPTLAATETVDTPVPAVAVPAGRGESILVVDDEPSSGVVIARLLERLGYKTTYCSDPYQALTLIETQRPALLLTDLAMPGLPGDELAKASLARRPDLPVMLLSGFIEPGKMDALRALGIREIFGKPPVTADLAAAINRCLNGSTPPMPLR